MNLGEYADKRDFSITPEPPADAGAASGRLQFVVQKHKAAHLHYDLRLELQGTLKSWAVPKGPSMVPSEKRLAVMVEDHPLDYASFEGVIPEGNYGAGAVMVWDRGVYQPANVRQGEDAEQAVSRQLQSGRLTILLHGQKLKGRFSLVKLKGKEDNAWLLIKGQDEFAAETDSLDQEQSVVSGRSLEEITRGTQEPERTKLDRIDLSDAPEAEMPHDVRPMLATLTQTAFDDPDWLFEIKWDGYRAIAEIERGAVRLYSRNGQSFIDRFSPIVKALSEIEMEAVIDGEIVVVDEKSTPRFDLLQNYPRVRGGTLLYYVFDILYLEGHSLVSLPLVRRKEILQAALPSMERVRFSSHIMGNGAGLFRETAARGLEGILAKRAQSIYRIGQRSRDWLKVRSRMRQEAVIGGFTEPRGSRKWLGSLMLGIYTPVGFEYVGSAGSGIADNELKKIAATLQPLVRSECPFVRCPKTKAPAHWVLPRVVCEVEFTGWTESNRMRHPVVIGIREDKAARVISREKPEPPPSTIRHGDASDSRTIMIGRTAVQVTNLNKLYWPEDGFTKGDLISYYRDIAPIILPHLRDRPESLNRHPDGIHGESFFQKDIKDAPDWVSTVRIHSSTSEESTNYLLCQDEATLVYLANLGCIEINPWASRIGSLEMPDYLVVDLDPEDIEFEKVIEAARAVNDILEKIGVESYCKTSGASGLHIYVPLNAGYSFDQARMFAQLIADAAHRRIPSFTSLVRSPAKRQERVYLDYLQNRYGATVAAPYCVRPRAGATVSTPILWDEVRSGLDPTDFTIRTIVNRLDRLGDIFTPVLSGKTDLAVALARLKEF